MAMMTISPRLVELRGDCKSQSGPTVRHIASAGGWYAPDAGPDPAAGGGRG
jgi:hypothetical protein